MSAELSSATVAPVGSSIVPHVAHGISPSDRDRATRLASRLLEQDPRLPDTGLFGPRVGTGLRPGPTLHIHDTERLAVSGLTYGREHRALLLAGDGDLVAMSHPPVRAFQEHCRDDLNLGAPSILVPSAPRRPASLSIRTLDDVEALGRLGGIARAYGGLNVMPYIATGDVWALAGAIARESGVPIRVAGPPTVLSRRVNDKIWFSARVSELLGRRALPMTTAARGWATLAHRVRQCARSGPSVGIKLPSASGASGNFVIDASLVLRLPSLKAVAGELRRLLRHLGWAEPFPMLVSVWEESVLLTPSAQLWIPRRGDGDPIVEGVFDQKVEGEAGKFVGCTPSSLSGPLKERLAHEAALLGLLFQELGYFGRCSLDSILVGEELSGAELHWIECNGRWGGTSIPMTLANRLVGDWAHHPFVVIGSARGESAPTFEQVRAAVADLLFDRARGAGLILLSPAPAETGIGVDFMSVGRSLLEAQRTASRAIDVVSRAGAG